MTDAERTVLDLLDEKPRSGREVAGHARMWDFSAEDIAAAFSKLETEGLICRPLTFGHAPKYEITPEGRRTRTGG